MLLFAVALALVTAIAFGVVPAMLMARGDMQRPLKESGRGGDGGGARRRARSVLVVAEIGLAVMLLVGAALLARSFQRLVQQDPGFKPARAVTAKVELPYSYSDLGKIVDFYDRLLTSLRAEPGVIVAGASNFLPLEAAWRGPFFIQGRPRPRSGDESQAQHQTIDDDYFRALGVPLVKGRFFEARDTAAAPGVVIVNDALARRQWPGEDPIGQSLMSPITIIGPMGRSLMGRHDVPGRRRRRERQELHARARRRAGDLFHLPPVSFSRHATSSCRGRASRRRCSARCARRSNDSIPICRSSSARTLDRIIGDATDRPRALMMLMGVFAALALVLSALGIYSVLSYSVNQRRQELSVRMALGAQPRDVLWLVVKQGLWLAMIGGVGRRGGRARDRPRALEPAVRRLVGRCDGIHRRDRSGARHGALACLLPARRAAALDPLAGLRAD